jgi:hypothetical protein
MLSIGVSLLVISLLVEAYLSYLHAAQIQQSIIKLQTNIETVDRVLRQEIQLAGYIGCARLTKDFPLTTSTPETLTINNRLSGLSAQVIVRYQSPETTALYSSDNHQLLEVGKNIHFKRGDTLLISSCRHAEIFSVDKVRQREQSQVLQLAHPLKYQYGADAEVGMLKIHQ